MQKEILHEMILQNQFTCAYAFDRVLDENKGWKLNSGTSSIGFIFRHVGEIMNLFGYFFGKPTDITNTTMGESDAGLDYDIETSRSYIDRGYSMLKSIINESSDEDWLLPVETPFFGTVSRMRLFSHVLFHNSHHAGQISLTLSKGKMPDAENL